MDLVGETLVKSRIPSCAREIRERLTRLQGEELAGPAEDDEPVDEPIDDPIDEFGDEHVEEPVELQEEKQSEQDLHAVETMLRRVRASLGHPSKGSMLRLLRDANAPPEIMTVARDFHCPQCDLMTRRTGAVRPVQVSRGEELGHTFQLMRATGRETEMDLKRPS